MDFLIISDHETIEGAEILQKVMKEYSFAFPMIIGEEIAIPDGHFNAYPLAKRISNQLGFDGIIKAAREQNAAIQWNHPGGYTNRKDHLENGLQGLDLDAWEHIPPKYDEWKAKGMLPTLTGSSDTHTTTFPMERSFIMANRMKDGFDIANAVKSGNVAILLPNHTGFIFGSDKMIQNLINHLSGGADTLRQQKAEFIKEYFKNFDPDFFDVEFKINRNLNDNQLRPN